MADGRINLDEYIQGGAAIIEAAKSVRGLKSAVTQLSKGLEEDGKRIQDGFAKIAAAITAIQGKGGNLNLANDAEKKQLQDLIRELDSLKLAKEAQKQADRDRIATQKVLGDATATFTKQLREQREAFTNAYKAGDTEGARQAALNIQGLTQQSNQLAKAVRGTASEFTAAKGSYTAASQELASLRAELRSIGGGLDSAGKGFDSANPRVAELQKRIGLLDGSLRAADKSIGQSYRNVGNYADSIIEAVRALEQEKSALLASNTALTAQARVTGLTADQQNKLQQELKETDARLDEVNKSLAGYGVGVANTGGTVKSFVGDLKGQATALAGSYIGLQAILGAAQSIFNNLVEFSDAAVSVQKTTGLTADEFDNLAQSLAKLDTRTSLAGLLDIAKVGGQLGIAKTDILEFTKAIDVAVQALGDDFAGGAEEIAVSLGKLNTVFGKELGPDISKNLLNIGSAVNELGAVGAATSPFLVDVAQRVGAVAAQAKVGLNNVLSYAAVLEETGFSAERSGTALNRLFSTLSTKTDASFKIAKLADSNLTLKEFTRLVNQDFNGAIQLFLKGLNAGGKTTTDLNKLLGTLKLSSGEAKNVIVTLAQNTELFAERQRVANEQLANGNSLATEAALKNKNLAAEVNKIQNSFTKLTTTGAISEFFKELVGETVERVGLLVAGLNKVNEAIDALKTKLGLATKEQVDYTLAIVNHANKSKEQATANQKLLDTYVALTSETKRSSAQELQLAETRNKLIVQFGTTEAAAIQKRIDTQKNQFALDKTRLETDVKTYDAYIRSTQARTAQLQEDANKAQLAFKTRFNLTPEGQKNIQDAAASNKLLNSLNGRNFPKEQIDAAKELNRIQGLLAGSTKQLAAEQLKRSQALAALKKLSDTPVKPADTGGDDTAGDEATDALNKAAKARALARKQDLENQLAYQKALIEDTKEFQAEQAKLFEDQQITPGIYEERVRGTQDTINDAIREGGRIRIEIAKQERIAADADAREALDRILNNEKKSYAERKDAQGEYFAKIDQDMQAFKGKIFQINRDIQNQLKSEPIEFKVVGINTKDFLKGQDDIATSSEKTIQRLNDNIRQFNDKNEAQRQIDKKNEEDDQERKMRLIEQGIDFAIQAEQTFFNIRAQYNQKRIQDLEEAKNREVAIAGDNAALREQIESNYDKKIRDAKKKAFKNDQQAAIAQVAINTAIAIAKNLASIPFPAVIPFIALAAAAGALQVAAIKAQPMPQYFKGRQGGPAEFAMVGERGAELITGRSGGARLVEKPSIAYLQQGDTVHTAEKTREILRTAEIQKTSPVAVTVSFQRSSAALDGKAEPTMSRKEWEELMLRTGAANARLIVNAIKNQKITRWDMSPYGVIQTVEKNGSLTREMIGRMNRLGLK